jgi:beta-glucosidase-like glycosyl hydrolase
VAFAAASLAATAVALAGNQLAPVIQPAEADVFPYQDTALPFDVRAADLVSRMTRTEKIQQFRAERQYQAGIAPRISRLGVEPYNYWNEAMHGVAHAGRTSVTNTFNKGGYATEFPSPIAMGASWNRSLILQAGTVVSDEGRAMSNFDNTGNAEGYAPHKGLTYWTPTINLARDPRWGRGEESYSEDPYLTAQMAGQYVDGLQGNDPKYLKVASTPKHFFANHSENDRRYGSEVVTEREMREYYTSAFADLLGPAHRARSLMTSYNAVNDIPSSANRFALETMVRRTWGFTGTVTSDCGAITDVHVNHRYTPADLGTAVTQTQAVAYTLKAGTDLDCSGGDYAGANGFPASLNAGNMTEADMDVSLTRTFALRMETGEFDPAEDVPWRSSRYSIDNIGPNTPVHQDAAQKTSDESVVLLKNAQRPGASGRALPLAGSDLDNVVIVGPQAQISVHGNYSPTRRILEVSPLDAMTAAIKRANPSATVTFIPGISGNPRIGANQAGDWSRGKPTIGSALTVGSAAAAVRFLAADGSELGRVTPSQIYLERDFIGWQSSANVYSAASLTTNRSWGGYLGFGADVPQGTAEIELRMANAGTTVLPNSFFDLRVGTRFANPIATLPGDGGGNGYQRVAYTGPTGATRLYFTYRSDYYQTTLDQPVDPADPTGPTQGEAIAAADTVIGYVGTLCSNNQTQPVLSGNPADAREDEDRPSDQLGRAQDKLLAEVAKLNPHTIAYIAAVGQVDVKSFQKDAGAILWTAYNGQYQSETVGRLLLGTVNPSGKLPMTWYANVDQLPVIYDYAITPTGGRSGRTYQYFTGPVTYPFGHGLSYSAFSYSNLRLSAQSLSPDGRLTATVDVANTSDRDGKEVVELYVVSPLAADPMYPDIQLKAFEKVAVGAGQTKTVTLDLAGADLWFWDDAADKKVFPTGTWRLYAGPSADTSQALPASFELTGARTPGVETVAVIPDGVTLNTATPSNVIHANLSATRNDQSFYDLSDVAVAYTTSNPAAATVSDDGVVRVGTAAGIAVITATVTADGTSGSASFPVVAYAGAETSNSATLFDSLVQFGDVSATLAQAAAGVRLTAALAPASATATYEYRLALGEDNTAEASITGDGLLTAARAGAARVTVVAVEGTQRTARTATVVITDPAAPAKANTAAVRAAIDTATAQLAGLDPESVTAGSLAAARQALDQATAALADPASTQAQLDTAAAALLNAVAGLVPRGDLTAVEAALAAAQALNGHAAGFTPASWEALTAAMQRAAQVLAAPADVTEAQAAAAAAALQAAIAALAPAEPEPIPVPERYAEWLRAQVNLATALVGPESDYTAASWADYVSVLAEAFDCLAQVPVVESQAASVYARFGPAFDALQRRVPTGQLSAVLSVARSLALDAYTADSGARVTAAITDAQALLGQDPDRLTQAGVDGAVAALQAAISALAARPAPVAPPADQPAGTRADLSTLADAFGRLPQSGYTAETWAALTAALAGAKAVLADPTAGQDRIDAAIVAVTSAHARLVASTPPTPGVDPPKALPKIPVAATPKIKGKAKVGKKLTASKGKWTAGTDFTYRWYANGKAIKKATKSTLKLTKAVKGKKITVKVTGSLAGHTKVAKTSKATKKVAKK